MRKGRIEVEFGGGVDTILYSVKENRFFSYEGEKEELHRTYGGYQYYSSRTGLTGAGYLKIAADNDLIVFGYYRTDAASEQSIATVHAVDGRSVFGYAPITSHGGIDRDAPFILADGDKVAFVRKEEVRNTLLKWSEVEGKKIEFSFFDQNGRKEKITFELYNPDSFRRVRASRFIDLRYAREATREIASPESLFERKLNIVHNNGCWFHLSVDGILDMKWDENPRNIEGEIVPGWIGAGDGLYWRRRRDDVEAFMEIKRSTLNGGKYRVEGETPEFIDYEQNFSIIEWFSKFDEWKDFFVTQLTKKARRDYIYARERNGIDTRQLMEQSPEIRIYLQDSFDCGNCRPATEEFIKRYKIRLYRGGITVKNLLENSSIDEMLRNFNFQKVIHFKLLDPNKE